jgi:hypothetical protein
VRFVEHKRRHTGLCTESDMDPIRISVFRGTLPACLSFCPVRNTVHSVGQRKPRVRQGGVLGLVSVAKLHMSELEHVHLKGF